MRVLARVIPIFIALMTASVSAEDIHYRPLPREAIETRLKQAAGKDSQREKTLKEMFQQAGCDEPHLTEQHVKGSDLPNVICTLSGSSESTIIVGAHYDHDGAGGGVVDNWTGASLLPSLYEAIKNEPRKHTFIFIGFTDEEGGLVGSRYYAKTMTKEAIARTDAMVNMDTLGLGSTEVETGNSDKQLTNALGFIARKLDLSVKGVNVGAVGITDSRSFSERKIPSITIHSLTQEAMDARILHSPRDNFSAIRMNDYYQTYCLLSAYLSLLDLMPPPANTESH